jgi:hypothetical protein
MKSVTFNKRVKVIYFKQTSIESNICWQQVARDRMRFKHRMLEVEQCIGWVFTNGHRERVYKALYQL